MKSVYSSQYQTTCFGQTCPSSGLTVSLKYQLCKWAMLWRSQHQSLLCGVYLL